MSKDTTPPRGDAAWRAAKQEIAERNAAAHARVRQERTEQDTARRRRQALEELAERASLPSQPSR